MKIDKLKVKRILLITLSNIGDAVLTLPVLGVLKREFPQTDITVMAGQSAKELFEAEPSVKRIIIYDKHMRFFEKLRFGLGLRRQGFDLVLDLRNSLYPLLIGARYNTPIFIKEESRHLHRKDKHLARLSKIGISIDNAPFAISFTRDDKLHVNSVLNEMGLLPDDSMIAVAAGAKSHTKRWMREEFIKVCGRLTMEENFKVILVGDDNDKGINREIATSGVKEVYDVTGRTTLRELAYLLSLCKLIITNDSAPLHIASAVGIASVAIFGPTDPKKYGPIYPNSIVVRTDIKCSPCEKALCRFEWGCMKGISADKVFNAAKSVLLK